MKHKKQNNHLSDAISLAAWAMVLAPLDSSPAEEREEIISQSEFSSEDYAEIPEFEDHKTKHKRDLLSRKAARVEKLKSHFDV